MFTTYLIWFPLQIIHCCQIKIFLYWPEVKWSGSNYSLQNLNGLGDFASKTIRSFELLAHRSISKPPQSLNLGYVSAMIPRRSFIEQLFTSGTTDISPSPAPCNSIFKLAVDGALHWEVSLKQTSLTVHGATHRFPPYLLMTKSKVQSSFSASFLIIQ